MNETALNNDDTVFELCMDPERALSEITAIVLQMSEPFASKTFEAIFKDIQSLFNGTYAGYRSSNTRYHDFEHTVSVVLATARLMHGCHIDGRVFSSRELLLTLIAALLHDVGLIQKIDDTEGSGAKYTVGHEERSVSFLEEYLAGKAFSADEIETCGNFIRCTILSVMPDQIFFANDTYRTLGYIVGTADLLAQMADRLYLEKLLLLYKEFEEARLPGFDSELELIHKTKNFYEFVAVKRLNEDLDGVCTHMQSHFKIWLDSDEDGYAEAISRNLRYLQSLVAICQDSLRCYLDNLKRGGITQQIIEELPPEENG